jgi:hypothetical protein
MSKHRQSYLLNDEKQSARLEALAQSPNTLEDERILCKFLCEQAANAGHAGLAASIAQTIAKISRIEIQNKVATGELLGRDQAIALIRTIVEAVASEVEGQFDGWEDCLIRIGDRIDLAMQQDTMNLYVVLVHAVWKGLDRHVANRAASRYIAEHFQPSQKRNARSIYALKHDFERAETRYITEDGYSECLRQCGFKVIDGKVFAEEVDVML